MKITLLYHPFYNGDALVREDENHVHTLQVEMPDATPLQKILDATHASALNIIKQGLSTGIPVKDGELEDRATYAVLSAGVRKTIEVFTEYRDRVLKLFGSN